MTTTTKSDNSHKKKYEFPYIIFENNVYRIDEYVAKHPGGEKVLLSNSGNDVTNDFYATGHSKYALQLLKEQLPCLGSASDNDIENLNSLASSNLWSQPIQLASIEKLNNHNCYEFAFHWEDSKNSNISLGAGGHIRLLIADNNNTNNNEDNILCSRSYTPVEFNSKSNTMKLAIKLYPNGEMSNFLSQFIIENNNTIDEDDDDNNNIALDSISKTKYSFRMTGPFENSEILNCFSTASTTSNDTHMYWIAAGTGITPFISVLLQQQSLSSPSVMSNDSSKLTLIYLSSSEDEIMYGKELDTIFDNNNTDNKSLHILSPVSKDNLVSKVLDIVNASNSSSTHTATPQFIICGPPKMEESLRNSIISQNNNDTNETNDDIASNHSLKITNPEKRILCSTLLSLSSKHETATAPLKQKKSSSTSAKIPMNVYLVLTALIVPMIAILLNRGIAKSWPHLNAFETVGMIVSDDTAIIGSTTGTDNNEEVMEEEIIVTPSLQKPLGLNGNGFTDFIITGFPDKYNITNAHSSYEPSDIATGYAYKLQNPTLLQYISPWIGYFIHQLLTLYILYTAFKLQPNYSMEFRSFNYNMAYVQIFGIALKYLQQYFFYNGLSETLPLGFGTGTVFLYLLIVMIMFIPTRGLFFGYCYAIKFMKDCCQFFKIYHGFFISIFIINDFWYHPFESTIGHLCGIFNDAMLLIQMVIIYMPFHLNRYWCLLIETFVIFHAAAIAMNRGTPGSMGMFGFAYFFIFIVTQQHGPIFGKKSKAIRILFTLLFITSLLVVYGLKLQGENKGFKAMIMEVFLRIPVLQYFTIFFIFLYFNFIQWIFTKCCILKPINEDVYDDDDVEEIVEMAIMDVNENKGTNNNNDDDTNFKKNDSNNNVERNAKAVQKKTSTSVTKYQKTTMLQKIIIVVFIVIGTAICFAPLIILLGNV